jgi:hypothetical protein
MNSLPIHLMGHLTGRETLNEHQQKLYLRLQNFCLDAPGGAIPFAAKLACEQSWSVAKSERVIDEYRRFLFLALEADHPVSPSRAVDLAWHQHLLDTRSYWQEFCPQVLGQPLHHTPSRGGEEERQRMVEWYLRTLASYRSFFGEPPPADLWPAVDRPAAESQAAAPQRRRRVGHRWGMLLASLLIALGLGGCQAGYQHFPFSLNGPSFLLLYLAIAGGAFLAVLTMHTIWGEQACAGDVIVVGSLWTLGTVRIVQGLSLHRPVAFLFIAQVWVTFFLIKALANNLVPNNDRADWSEGLTNSRNGRDDRRGCSSGLGSSSSTSCGGGGGGCGGCGGCGGGCGG